MANKCFGDLPNLECVCVVPRFVYFFRVHLPSTLPAKAASSVPPSDPADSKEFGFVFLWKIICMQCLCTHATIVSKSGHTVCRLHLRHAILINVRRYCLAGNIHACLCGGMRTCCQTLPMDILGEPVEMNAAAPPAQDEECVVECMVMWLLCIFWACNDMAWCKEPHFVPYSTRIREYFQRWPGASKVG